MAKRAEDILQYRAAEWLRQNNIFFFHVPNEGKRSLREGSKLVAMGLVAGIPDIVILLPGQKTIFVELKTDSGTLSKKQEKIHEQITKMGYPCHLIQTNCPLRLCDSLAEIVRKHTS